MIRLTIPSIEGDDIQAVADVIASGHLVQGRYVEAFEQVVSDYVGAEYAVAVCNCTAALHLSLLTSGLKPGDEVITSPMTFCATVNAIIHTGATPVLADRSSCLR